MALHSRLSLIACVHRHMWIIGHAACMQNVSPWIAQHGVRNWKGKSKGMEVPLAGMTFRDLKKKGWKTPRTCGDGDTKQMDEHRKVHPDGETNRCQGHVNKNYGKKLAEVVLDSNKKSQWWLTKHQEECEFEADGNP